MCNRIKDLVYRLRSLGDGQLILTSEWEWYSGKFVAYIYSIDQVKLIIDHTVCMFLSQKV